MDNEFDLLVKSVLEAQPVEEGAITNAIGAAALAGSLALTTPSQAATRGIENNNPGNIVTSPVKWKGAIGKDGRFVKFDSMENGVRALARILKVYQKKYKINTIEGIIHRWAPPSDNNPTDKYVEFVSRNVGIPKNKRIDLNNPSHLYRLVDSIIKFENGSSIHDRAIARGIRSEAS